MSSLSSSQASLSSTPPSERAQSSLSLSPSYLPTALAQGASSFLRRFYTEPNLDHLQTQDSSANFEGKGHGGDGTYTPPPRRRPSPFQPPPLRPLILRGLSPTSGSMVGQSASPHLLSRALAEEIRLLVPPRLQLLEDWRLIYSLDHDGVSLATLYKKCEPWRTSSRRGFVMVVKDANGAIFGAYLSDPPYPSPHYYGTGECFLWRSSILSSIPLLSSLPPPPSSDTTHMTRSTTIANTSDYPSRDNMIPQSTTKTTSTQATKDSLPGKIGLSSTLPLPTSTNDFFSLPTSNSSSSDRTRSDTSSSQSSEPIRFKAFPYSGINEYMIFCQQGFLSLGGGDGHYGLWLDDVFEKGVSASCPTFGNEPLSDDGVKFDILGVEVWVLATPSSTTNTTY